MDTKKLRLYNKSFTRTGDSSCPTPTDLQMQQWLQQNWNNIYLQITATWLVNVLIILQGYRNLKTNSKSFVSKDTVSDKAQEASCLATELISQKGKVMQLVRN
jgi:hypothetical protein